MILMIRDMSRGHACAAGHIAPLQLPAVLANHEETEKMPRARSTLHDARSLAALAHQASEGEARDPTLDDECPDSPVGILGDSLRQSRGAHNGFSRLLFTGAPCRA